MGNKYHRLINGKMIPMEPRTSSGNKPEMGEPYRLRPAMSGESSYQNSSAGYKSTPMEKAKKRVKKKMPSTLRSY